MSAAARRRSGGELAIVLHTHMPYVEGFGTWPFGEEWLWEAIATSYLPLLDVLGRAPSPSPSSRAARAAYSSADRRSSATAAACPRSCADAMSTMRRSRGAAHVR